VTGPVHTGSSYRLAVSAEMVFVDLPFEDRVRRIADHGFEVEIWDWTKKDIAALAKTGATFSSMTGYITGTLADPDGAAELLRTAEQSLRVAEELDCPRLNVHGTGLDDKGLPVIPTALVTPNMWLTAAKTLTRLAELGERAGRAGTGLRRGNPGRRRPWALRAGHRRNLLPGDRHGAAPARLHRGRRPRSLCLRRPRTRPPTIPHCIHRQLVEAEPNAYMPPTTRPREV
jgi:hypothetical protein